MHGRIGGGVPLQHRQSLSGRRVSVKRTREPLQPILLQWFRQPAMSVPLILSANRK
jgi:hypothetical protein